MIKVVTTYQSLLYKFQTSDNKSTTTKVIANFLIKGIGAGLAFGLQFALAQMLGTKQFGQYVYVNSWMVLASIVTSFGFERLLTRFVAAFHIKQEWAELLGLVKLASTTVWRVNLLLGLAGVAGIFALREMIGSDLSTTFYFGFAFLLFYALLRSSGGVLRGFNKIAHAEFSASILQPVVVLLLCLITYATIGSLSASSAMFMTVVATAGSYMLVVNWIQSTVKAIVPAGATEKKLPYQAWLVTAFPFVMITGAHQLQRYCDTLMLGAMKSLETSGLYSAASQVTEILLLGILSVNMVAAPLISSYYSSGQSEQLKRLISLVSKASFLVTVVVAFILALFGRELLHLFGREFVQGYQPMMILMIGHVVRSLVGPVELISMMTGREWVALQAVGVSCLLNVVLNYLLIPHYGMNGAAIATATTLSLWNLWLAIDTAYTLQINPTIFGRLYR